MSAFATNTPPGAAGNISRRATDGFAADADESAHTRLEIKQAITTIGSFMMSSIAYLPPEECKYRAKIFACFAQYPRKKAVSNHTQNSVLRNFAIIRGMKGKRIKGSWGE